jgi:hypothetical protein
MNREDIKIISGGGPATEVLRLSREGIWANPDIPVDDAAKLVLAAIDSNVKVMVQKAVEAEREACAKVAKETVCDMHLGAGIKIYGTKAAAAVRARGQA